MRRAPLTHGRDAIPFAFAQYGGNGMNRSGSNTAARWLTAAAMALALAGPAAARAAEPGGLALMTVMGVVAPFSTFGLLKHLTGIKGVKEVHFDLQHGLARVQLLPGAVVTDKQLRDAVRSASYTPGDIRWLATQPTTASP